MNIFELARSAGVTPSVVRFYRRSGTLPAPRPQPDGRLGYDERDAARLRLAVALHRLGRDPAEGLAALDALLAHRDSSGTWRASGGAAPRGPRSQAVADGAASASQDRRR